MTDGNNFVRVAMPVFENRISPRFDCAPTLVLCDVAGQRVTDRKEIFCEGWSDIERISKLKEMKVDTLICGGLPSHLQGILKNNGVNIIPWVAGNSDEIMKTFLQGKLNPGMVIGPEKGKKERCKKDIKDAK
ncbi:MAG TPA: NifB/NifX family molybdenum-iron cluster-binding protein [Thermodesulfovibrionales bacterium]|nr:NifB/NifX family molybdenum-iron cluster-binding protein [Thermodesulfovibrionales bacterium]